MRALRAQIDALGVRTLDHHPALELLARADGSVGGARGLRRQHGDAPWEIHAGAVILAAGGTAFLSGLLGAQTNTGDGLLMAAEAGAELSGMEFTATYTMAPAHSNMTRSMAYTFATYYDEGGRELELRLTAPRRRGFSPAHCRRARAVLASSTARRIKARLHTISPNVPLVFDRWGSIPIDKSSRSPCTPMGPFANLGGSASPDERCATSVPGLFVAGDNASREKVAARSPAAATNSAWALTSGLIAGRAAAGGVSTLGTRSAP